MAVFMSLFITQPFIDFEIINSFKQSQVDSLIGNDSRTYF
jgi:hypothetical protein